MLTTRKAVTGFGLWGYLSGGEDVGRGAEPAGLSDYYVRVHGEAWGRGAQRPGLQTMTAHQFNSLAAGLSLDRRSHLVQTQNGKHCPGVDVQMSPPKSVSVELLAVDAEGRQRILAAHGPEHWHDGRSFDAPYHLTRHSLTRHDDCPQHRIRRERG